MLADRAIVSVVFLSGVLGACRNNISITPLNMTALSGSCVHIPCNFRVETGQTFLGNINSTAFWLKKQRKRKNDSVIFESSRKTGENYPMEVIGDLSQKNCTTVLYNVTTQYSHKYFFRVEDGKFKATAKCHPIRITVKDSPWRPLIEISGEQTENATVTLTCSADIPCPQAPPTLTWDLPQAPPTLTQVMETNTNGTFRTKIHQNITLTPSHDRVKVTCFAEYPVNGGVKTVNKTVTLNVTYAPKNTLASVSPSGWLSAGQTVNLSCSSTANPPVDQYSWFRISPQGPVHVYEGQRFTFTPYTNLTHTGDYYCVASNSLGNQSSVISLKIKEMIPPPAALLWEGVGGGVGLLVLICLGIFVWCFLSKRKAEKETQRETFVGADEVDSVLNVQVDFLKLRPKSGPDPEQDRGQREEPVYSQVRKKERAPPTEDIYATVKKK